MKKISNVNNMTDPKELDGSDATAAEKQAKKSYVKPKLESWGSLADLTKNAPVGGGDALGGGSTT